MKLPVLLFLFLLSSFDLCSQSSKTARIEVLEQSADRVYSLPLENKMLVLVEHLQKKSSNDEPWLIEVFKPNFQKFSAKEILLPPEFVLTDHFLQNDSILWLYFNYPKGKGTVIQFFRLNLLTMQLINTEVIVSKPNVIQKIVFIDNQVFLLGVGLSEMQSKLDAFKLPYDLSFKALDLPQNSRLISLLSNPYLPYIQLLIQITKGEQEGYYLWNYYRSKLETKLIALPQLNSYFLIEGNKHNHSTSGILLLGNYMIGQGKPSSKEMVNTEGFFITHFQGDSLTNFKAYPLSEFKNIYLAMTGKTATGKSSPLKYQLLLHEKGYSFNDQIVLAAESYTTEYHYESNFDARGYMYQTEVFDGYQTQHCFLASFNENGDLLWNNYMPVSNVRSDYVQQNITAFNDHNENMVMAYYNQGSVTNLEVQSNATEFKRNTNKLEVLAGESIINEQMGQMVHWYDNYFLVSGYQIIYGLNSKKRKVFYFNLVTFD